MRPRPLPAEFRQKVPSGAAFFQVKETLRDQRLNTVCEEAKCPNRTDCYARGTLTFQILGDICTRRCGFCAEKTGQPGAVDFTESARIAVAIETLKLKHVVLTAPARDDLSDGGASVFARTVRTIKNQFPFVTVEILISDLQGDLNALQNVLESGPDVFNHNIETVRRLTPRVRAKATYERSLDMLKYAAASKICKVKSGLMVGLGESLTEIEETLQHLRDAGVQYLTVGQYLQPSAQHLPIERYYNSEEFAQIRSMAKSQGFEQIFSGPLIRSSYHADEMMQQKIMQQKMTQ